MDVVLLDGSHAWFSATDYDCLTSAVGYIRDRHRGKHLESTSHASNSYNSSKNHLSHTGNCSETAPPAMSYHAGRPSNMTGPTSPDLNKKTYRDPSTCFLDGFSLFEADPIDFNHFHRGDSRPEVVVRSGSRCGRRVLSMDCDCQRLA